MSHLAWFSPAPLTGEVSERLSLDFGLRDADRYFRELVVPGLGRVWFVRQLSWSAAAIHLASTLSGSRRRPASSIAQAIEALGSKLEFRHSETSSGRVLGSRAFGRDREHTAMSFADLSRARHYVRNTHRQLASYPVRALGFAEGTRYNALTLTPVGTELAKVTLDQPVGRGGESLERWLAGWIHGEDDVPRSPRSLTAALSPVTPTSEERRHVKEQLLKDPKRARLFDLFTTPPRTQPQDVDQWVSRLERTSPEQANEIRAARAFGRVQDALYDLARAVTLALSERESQRVDGLAPQLESRVGTLRAATNAFVAQAQATPTASVAHAPGVHALAREIERATLQDALWNVLSRAADLFLLDRDRGVVLRGHLYRVLPSRDAAASDAADDAGGAELAVERSMRLFRLGNLHSLVRDCAPGRSR